MKAIIITLLFNTFCLIGLSQHPNTRFADYPFDIELLQHLADNKDSIMPTFNKGKFAYVNLKTGKKISRKTFDVAYPFNGRNAAIIKTGDKYGIVDRYGNLLVEPGYKSVILWNTPLREDFVSFDNAYNYVFDLQKKIFVSPGNGCVKFLPERDCCMIYKGASKYGVSVKDDSSQGQRPLIAPVFDTVYLINSTLAIGSKEGKIIAVDKAGKHLFLGESYDFIMSKAKNGYSKPSVIGLKTSSEWEYYSVGATINLLLTSKFKCLSIGEVQIKNAFGIYEEKGKYHILFLDNHVMTDSYDWIADNGTIGIINDAVYIIGGDGIPFLYYRK